MRNREQIVQPSPLLSGTAMRTIYRAFCSLNHAQVKAASTASLAMLPIKYYIAWPRIMAVRFCTALG